MNLETLRIRATSQSLFPPTTLKAALDRLGFVQADPIRSPARAHDLILRHRVKGYRAGDLERRYPALDIEEDVLYAYGFLPRAVWKLLHPRKTTGLTELQKKVLETVGRSGEMHPRALEAHFGRERVVNAWGGYSKATTRALEDLHYRGLLRIARRENGIRVYEPAPPADSLSSLPPGDRLRKLTMVIAAILAPVPARTLSAIIAPFRRLGNTRAALAHLLGRGELQEATIEGLQYVWPSSGSSGMTPEDAGPRRVRFLAPFDPVVWDRRRFEHLWRWPYRFEAYTPPAKRLRGYYAMPLLWGESIIGWVNARVDGGSLSVDLGFVESRPREKAFGPELDAEIARFETFLRL